MRKIFLVLLVLLGVAAAGCGGSSGDTAAPATETQTEATDTTTSADGCSDVTVPPAREDGGGTQPKERLDPEKTYDLVVKTNCGTFTITLDQAGAPATSASLVSLAKSDFFGKTIFHRIIPGFVIQGGDPTASGSGGPGYQTVDPPAADAKYTKGVVAMAKTSAEAPGTSGSQFFVVTGADASLPAEYAIVGNVTNGIDVVDRIGALGDPATEQPTRPVVIESVTVVER